MIRDAIVSGGRARVKVPSGFGPDPGGEELELGTTIALSEAKREALI
jgi:hypothetical protein